MVNLDRLLARYAYGAVAVYAFVVVMLLWLSWGSVADVLERRESVAAASHLIEQLEARGGARGAGGADAPGGQIPAGSPFLEGQTVTIAGAALLQRVGGAVTRVGGNVLSSQVDLQGPRAREGFVGVVASCEMTQTALQQLIYDLEAGMPFLFLDQLVVQTPATVTDEPSARLRVLVAVSGQWQNAR